LGFGTFEEASAPIEVRLFQGVKCQTEVAFMYHYAVVGLQESERINVLSLEQRTSVGCIIRPDHTPREYRTYWCEDPMPTDYDAASAALDKKVTLRLELVKW
jgi:hypothetical protein